MNDPEFKSPLPQDDLSAQVASLQRQVFMLLLVLLVVSATLAAYLRYEDYVYHKDAAAIRPQAMNIINTFNKAKAEFTQQVNPQGLQNFITQLVAYGQKNPDFAQQVLIKHGIVPPPATNAPVKPAASAPAAPKK